MTEPNASGQDPTNSNGQEPSSAQTPSGQDPTEPQKTGELDGLTPEQLKELLAAERSKTAAVNREAAKTRTELKKLQDAEDERKKAELSDVERLTAEKTKAENDLAQARREALDARIASAAHIAGAVDPDDIVRLIDREALGEAKAEEIKSAIESLKKAKPHLFGAAKVPATEKNNSGGGPENASAEQKRKQAAADFPFLRQK